MLCVIETHPVQYHAPVYRALEQECRVPVTAVYGSDFSVAGYTDREFQTRFSWDTDLLGGYSQRFLSRVSSQQERRAAEVSTRGLRQVLKELKPGAILLVGYGGQFNRVAFWEARRTRRPLLFRAETTDHGQARRPMKAWVRDRILRWYYRSFERLLYIGQHSRAHYMRLGVPRDRLVFSPYCVDTAAFALDEEARRQVREATRKALGVPTGCSVILFSGKLSGRKGVDLLLSAVKSLPIRLRSQIALVFMGAGELEEELKAEASMQPKELVRFVGFQNQSQLSRFYHAADLLVLPSCWSETWGLVVNEALHHGVPCVVSDAVGCAPDLVIPGITGEVCETRSAVALGRAIERALTWIGEPRVRIDCCEQVAAYTVKRAAEGLARACTAVLPTNLDRSECARPLPLGASEPAPKA